MAPYRDNEQKETKQEQETKQPIPGIPLRNTEDVAQAEALGLTLFHYREYQRYLEQVQADGYDPDDHRSDSDLYPYRVRSILDRFSIESSSIRQVLTNYFEGYEMDFIEFSNFIQTNLYQLRLLSSQHIYAESHNDEVSRSLEEDHLLRDLEIELGLRTPQVQHPVDLDEDLKVMSYEGIQRLRRNTNLQITQLQNQIEDMKLELEQQGEDSLILHYRSQFDQDSVELGYLHQIMIQSRAEMFRRIRRYQLPESPREDSSDNYNSDQEEIDAIREEYERENELE